MTQEQRLVALAQQIATVAKGINAKVGDVTTLTTTQKSNVVSALNELKSTIDSLPGVSSIIDDATSSLVKTYSSTKINDLITTAITNLINGAGTDADTLKELADKIVALAQTDNGLVSGMIVQAFTAPQQAQARANIGSASASDLSTLTTNIGNTDRDFVADFNTTFLA